jgi:hypothetical protein
MIASAERLFQGCQPGFAGFYRNEDIIALKLFSSIADNASAGANHWTVVALKCTRCIVPASSYYE